MTEDLELFDRCIRVTQRLAYYVYQLRQVMTVTEVANHLNLDWKMVKGIDKNFLAQRYGQPDLNRLRILNVDEIAARRGHRYLTVLIDYLSGRVLFVGKDRRDDTLQRKGIEAVAMDMWDPFIKAVKKNCRRLKLYLICFMSYRHLAGSSIRKAISSTAGPPMTTKQFLKAIATCC